MHKTIIISGPTASGKSSLAQAIYESAADFAIVNADSMQIYKELPILTAQPVYTKLPDHHLYGAFRYDQRCSVASWLEMAKKTIVTLHALGKTPIFVGGTGLYIKSLIYGLSDLPDIAPEVRAEIAQLFNDLGIDNFYQLLQTRDPLAASRIRPSDSYRMIRAMEVFRQAGKSIVEFYDTNVSHCEERGDIIHLTLSPTRQTLYNSCNKRFLEMVENGALEEVAAFSTLPNSSSSLLAKSLGYEYLRQYLAGEITFDQAVALTQIQTRQYAKRQVTWFKHQAPEAVTLSDDNFAEMLKQALSQI